MTLRKNSKIDDWFWRCAPNGCQKTKSIRTGTLFYENRIQLFQVLLKNHIKLGGEGKLIKIDVNLFIKVKHNRGRDILRPKVGVFGLYERTPAMLLRATLNFTKVLFKLRVNRFNL